jgi:hypothetical protein
VYPLWESVIAPTLEGAAARRVVEIGALRGQTTVRLLELLGPEAELHVIDPVPQFDPAEHERRFPGRYHFHRDISHNVLPTLPAMDAALIDGDHNWYTVYNELKMLAASAREADAPLPVLLLHDVGWPYGRRDLYHAPERIPDQFRHPYAQKGLRLPGRSSRTDLLDRGGFNPTMNNALQEGGPRNGVMTAVEDFMAEHDRALRILVLPVYFSLAIVTEEERIAARPELGRALERLERPELLRELLELSEHLRLKEMHWAHVAFFSFQEQLERTADRYLDLLRADLGDEMRALVHLQACLDTIRAERVEGDFVQCGTAGAEASIFMRGFAEAHRLQSARVWVAGSGPGLRERFRRFELLDERVNLLSGPLQTALAGAPMEKVALLRVGSDAPAGEALELLYDHVGLGGYVVVDGYATSGRRDEVDRFRADRGVDEPLEPIDPGAGAGWRKVS